VNRSEPIFPNVRCDFHPGPDEPGYAVCQHVANGAVKPFHFEPATTKALGSVLCRRCFDVLQTDEGLPESFLILSCAHSVREKHWDTAGAGSLQ
jgi:hypothetical protein